MRDLLRSSRTSRWFLFCEVACFFFYSIWWRKDISPIVGISAGFAHLVALILLLWWWERARKRASLVGKKMMTRAMTASPAPAGVLLLLAGAVQLFFLNDPIFSGTDEPVMLIDHYVQVSLFSSMAWYLQISMVVCVVAIWCFSVLLVQIRDTRAGNQTVVTHQNRSRLFFALGLFTAFIAYLIVETQSPHYWGLAERWPPLGTIASMPFQYLLPDKVLAIRLSSVAYYIGTGVLVYTIAGRLFGSRAALVSLLFVLLAPVSFSYGHYAFREIGGVFFFTLSVYFFLNFLASRDLDYYGLSIAAAALGYMQRRPSLLVIFIFAVVLLVVYRGQVFKKENFVALTLPVVALVWLILPWYLLSRGIRPYVPYLDNLSRVDILISYPLSLPRMAGWPLVILSVCGLLAGLIRKQIVVVVLLLWVGLLSLLFAMDVTAPAVIERFTAQFIPPLALLAGYCFAPSRTTPGQPYQESRLMRGVVPGVAVVGVLTFANWLFDGDRAYSIIPKDGMRYESQRLYPYDQLADALAHAPREMVLYQSFPWQSAFPTYLRMRKLQRITFKEATWKDVRGNADASRALKNCQRAACTHLVEPVKPSGELLFYDGEFVDQLVHFSEVHSIKMFTNRHGGVALVEIQSD